MRRLLAVMALGWMACPPPRVDFGKDGEPRSADELLRRTELAETSVIAVKGDAKVVVDSPQGRGAIGLFAAVLHPAFLHLEQLDFFNRPQGVLTTDGETFALFDSQAGKFFRGPASASNLGRFLPLVMPPRELASILLGRAPRIPGGERAMAFDAARRVFVLTLKNGSVTQVLHVQPPSYRVVKSTLHGLDAYELDFDDVRPQGGVSFPTRARLTAARAQTSLELVWKDLAVNDVNDLTLFHQEPPPQVPVIEVDESGAPRTSSP